MGIEYTALIARTGARGILDGLERSRAGADGIDDRVFVYANAVTDDPSLHGP